MKKLLFILSFTLFCSQGNLFAQRIVYSYDNAGNRTSRQQERTSQTRAFSDETFSLRSMENGSELKITVSPNPTKDVLRVDLSGKSSLDGVQISLYNLSGAMLMQQKDVAKTTTLNMSAYSSGVYILRVTYADKIHHVKVVKE
jgi:hypothetical protein